MGRKSLKNGPAQYLRRAKCITRFLFKQVGVPRHRVWPLSFNSVARFFAMLHESKRVASTLEGYVAAFEWYADVKGYPRLSCRARLGRLIDGINFDVGANATSVLPITPVMLKQMVTVCREWSTYPGDCWHRNEVLYLTSMSVAARMYHEVAVLSTDRTSWSPTSFTIDLDFAHDKTAKLVERRRGTSVVSRLVVPATGGAFCAYTSCLSWWHATGLFESPSARPVFPGADPANPVSYDTVLKQMRQVLSHLGYDPQLYGLHSFRHGSATAAYNRGATVPSIRSHLRHKPKSSSTFRYLPRGARRAEEARGSQPHG